MIKFIKLLKYFKEMKRIKREMHFLAPIYEYTAPDKAWFELSWRLLRMYSACMEKQHNQDGSYQRDISFELTYETAFFTTLFNIVGRNVSHLNDYVNNYPAKCHGKTFCMGHLQAVDMFHRTLGHTINQNNLTIGELRILCNMMYFYNDFLVYVGGYESIRDHWLDRHLGARETE
ncbi:MAG: hypothetical protein K0Q73_5979 [Paenibacillus sp.]|jgi:hypothetical protein|nr:hypothetical protein [Paenibacillus sp.]